MAEITAHQLARMVDHTLLKPEATYADVEALVTEAESLGTWSVCVSPVRLPVVTTPGSGLRVAAVCGFPSGAHTPAVKAQEAAESVRLGADEIDMVIDLGAAKAGRWGAISEEIAAVRAAVDNAHAELASASAAAGETDSREPVVLKVIIESAALTDAEIVRACVAASEARADFVKTSTGFHPAGGATVHAVELMAATVAPHLGVKASGGIRTWADAVAMVEAGATRLGLSGTRAVLAGAPDGFTA